MERRALATAAGCCTSRWARCSSAGRCWAPAARRRRPSWSAPWPRPRPPGATGTAALAGAAPEQARVLAGHPRTDPPTASPPSEVEAEAIRTETGGLAALTAGEGEEAAAAFTRAVDPWRQLGLTVWLARALSLQSAAARRMADQPTADRLLTRADDVLDRLKTPAHARPAVLAPLGRLSDEA